MNIVDLSYHSANTWLFLWGSNEGDGVFEICSSEGLL